MERISGLEAASEAGFFVGKLKLHLCLHKAEIPEFFFFASDPLKWRKSFNELEVLTIEQAFVMNSDSLLTIFHFKRPKRQVYPVNIRILF